MKLSHREQLLQPIIAVGQVMHQRIEGRERWIDADVRQAYELADRAIMELIEEITGNPTLDAVIAITPHVPPILNDLETQAKTLRDLKSFKTQFMYWFQRRKYWKMVTEQVKQMSDATKDIHGVIREMRDIADAEWVQAIELFKERNK